MRDKTMRDKKCEIKKCEIKNARCAKYQATLHGHAISLVIEKVIDRPTQTPTKGTNLPFVKGEAIRLLRTNSSEKISRRSMCNFKTRLELVEARGYPKSLLKERYQRFPAGRQSALKKTNQTD